MAAVSLTASGVALAATVSSSPSGAPSFDGSVYAIAYAGDVVYVGGSFKNALVASRQIPRQGLAAFNARTGVLLDWKPAANATVRALAVSGSTVFAAGDFTTISGVSRPSLAAISTTGALTSFRHTVTGTPLALAITGGRLFLGGKFTSVDGYTRANLAAFTVSTGTLSAWAPKTDDMVNAMATASSRVYVGGRFRVVNGNARARHLAALNPTTGAVDTGFLPNPAQLVYGLTADTTGVYGAHGGGGGRAVAYSTTGRVRWIRLFDGDVQAVASLDGTVYVGGHFDKVCAADSAPTPLTCPGGATVARAKFAALTAVGGVLTSWAPRANGIVGVRTLVANAALAQVGAGGDFTQVNDVTRKRYAVFAAASSPLPRLGTIASYNFDTVSGEGAFLDISGNGHLLQAFTTAGATLQTTVHGTGRAVVFPSLCAGTGCPHMVLQAETAPEFNPDNGPIRYGVSMRLAPNQTGDGENLLQKGTSTAGGQYKLQIDKVAGKPSCGMTGTGSTTIYLAKSSVAAADGSWHAVECRRSGTQLSILVDNTVTGTTTIPADLAVNNTAPVVLGGKGLSENNDQFHGSLDDVWISRG